MSTGTKRERRERLEADRERRQQMRAETEMAERTRGDIPPWGAPRNNDIRQGICGYLWEHPGRTAQELAAAFHLSGSRMRDLLSELQAAGQIQAVPGRRTVWEATL